MKTPVQEVFSDLEANYRELFNVHTIKGRNFINKYSKFLEKEKEFVVDFFVWVRDNGDKHIGLSIEELVNVYFKNL
jgi:hypothetical protein